MFGDGNCGEEEGNQSSRRQYGLDERTRLAGVGHEEQNGTDETDDCTLERGCDGDRGHQTPSILGLRDGPKCGALLHRLHDGRCTRLCPSQTSRSGSFVPTRGQFFWFLVWTETFRVGHVHFTHQERSPLMALLLWIIAVVLVVAGIVAMLRRQVIYGLVLVIVGFLVGPGGTSLFV